MIVFPVICLALIRPVGFNGDGVVEGRDVADVRPQSSVLHPLDDLTQLGAIGLDNEVEPRNAFRTFSQRPADLRSAGRLCASNGRASLRDERG